jgi:hypothetical protein
MPNAKPTNTMKQLFYLLTIYYSVTATYGQIINGSFENGSNADLTNWEWTCLSQSSNNAPTGGGSWCILVWGGNTQGCFPGYAYQKLPAITNGQTFILSGWAYAQTSPPIGLYFGKINNGIITLQAGDTTSSTSWTPLSVQSGFSLSTGDTALVVLYGGQAGGPVQGYGYFDLINLQEVTGINSFEQKQFMKVFPNPFSNNTVLQTDNFLHNATLIVENIFGQTVKQIKYISGPTITLFRDNLPSGMYFIQLSQDDKIIATNKIIISE